MLKVNIEKSKTDTTFEIGFRGLYFYDFSLSKFFGSPT